MFDTLAYFTLTFYKDFSKYTAEKLQELDVNYGSLFFILYVGVHPGCTPSELTRVLEVDWGHSQRSISKLVKDGLITKEKKGRTYRLNLTKKGHQVFQVCHQVFFDWDEKRLSILTEEEQRELFRLVWKLFPEENRRERDKKTLLQYGEFSS
ncbi:MAG: MarR family transcriptional regulator [Eubacteriales bacterium]|nr:MarR family transcriptional regulator [Eubacteriales bacterium]